MATRLKGTLCTRYYSAIVSPRLKTRVLSGTLAKTGNWASNCDSQYCCCDLLPRHWLGTVCVCCFLTLLTENNLGRVLLICHNSFWALRYSDNWAEKLQNVLHLFLNVQCSFVLHSSIGFFCACISRYVLAVGAFALSFQISTNVTERRWKWKYY